MDTLKYYIEYFSNTIKPKKQNKNKITEQKQKDNKNCNTSPLSMHFGSSFEAN